MGLLLKKLCIEPKKRGQQTKHEQIGAPFCLDQFCVPLLFFHPLPGFCPKWYRRHPHTIE